ncbi:MAG: alpha/beta hydrolase [Telluria sp.]
MRTLLKIGKYLSIFVLAFLALAIVALLSLRTYSQHSNAKAYVIDTPKGINESGYVRIGGIEQWVQIRGQDRDNPVLLVLHGGPGGTLRHVTKLFIPWEKDFTIVQWDQRGAGKTLTSTGASIAETMSVDRMTKDGIEVAEHLRARLHKDKITILGHSWGSILGINMAKRRPDLFYAFVGTGQVANMPRSMGMNYANLLAQAQAAKDQETTRALSEIGPPPFENRHELEVFFGSIDRYPPASDRVAMDAIKSTLMSPPPGYSLRDVFDGFRGFMVVPSVRIYNEMLGTQLASLGPDFEIPVFFIHGTEDNLTQVSLAKEYFETIKAPHKEMVLLEGGGHFAFLSLSDRFLKDLVARVRPYATKSTSP